MTELKVKCDMCNKMHTIEIEEGSLARWEYNESLPDRASDPIQDVLPELSPADRELLLTKTCDKCWHKLYPNSNW